MLLIAVISWISWTVFKLLLKYANFFWTRAYYFAVTNFGGKGVKWFREDSIDDIQVFKMSWK